MGLLPEIDVRASRDKARELLSKYRRLARMAGIKPSNIKSPQIDGMPRTPQFANHTEDKIVNHLDAVAIINNTVTVNLSPAERKQYKDLERDLVLELGQSDVVAVNAAVLSNKLLQLANGAIYDDNGDAQTIHDKKIEALQRIVEEAQGQPILVFYTYKHDLERIQQALPEAKALDVKAGDVKKWNAGKIPILLAHPQSAGHGLNLQAGGHIIVWFGLTWSLEFYQQANARLDRQGQTKPVIVHHLVAAGTMDERVMDVLEGKRQGQDALLDAVKAKIDEYGRD